MPPRDRSARQPSRGVRPKPAGPKPADRGVKRVGRGSPRAEGGPRRPYAGAKRVGGVFKSGESKGSNSRTSGPGGGQPRGGSKNGGSKGGTGVFRRRRSARPRPDADTTGGAGVRLQKAMAAAGVGSRRHCEEMILAGRVEIDRKVVTELGTRVDPRRQEIRLDGVPLAQSRLVYYLLHKPQGIVSTNFDPSGRPRVIDLLPRMRERLFTVGRLDLSSEGMILLTNDGELAQRLAHPRFGVKKTYHVLVAGSPGTEVLARLRQGVHLAEGFAKVESVRVKSGLKQSTMLEIVLAEGRNREIRRILAKLGHKVLRLKRVAIGELRLRDLPPGEFRRLTADEVRSLHSAAKKKGVGSRN
jgi:23S rRNA pseudouridine2605 synthase